MTMVSSNIGQMVIDGWWSLVLTLTRLEELSVSHLERIVHVIYYLLNRGFGVLGFWGFGV